jgi:hypothetical protein
MADKKPGYGRRWEQWLSTYAVAGVVVYLIVYLAFFYHAGGPRSSPAPSQHRGLPRRNS